VDEAVDSAGKTASACGQLADSVELDVENHTGVTTRCSATVRRARDLRNRIANINRVCFSAPTFPQVTACLATSKRRVAAGFRGLPRASAGLPAYRLHALWASARMTPVGKHSGAREEPAPLPRRRLFLLALGITLTLVAWGFLVWAAIDFGAQARSGDGPAWGFLAIATVGATACLLVTLVLVAKVLTALRGEARQRAVVPGGRRRAG
jgi:hypothetical protein